MNPIIGHELRSRWRGWKAQALLAAYTIPLTLAVVLAYLESVGSTDKPMMQSKYDGQSLFITLSFVQIIGWILFAPSLTATSIASERERGLLESLQLSRLKPFQIVVGKLWSAIVFVCLVMISSLPIQAVCFWLGGITAAMFLQTTLLTLTTAITFATVGVFCSARSRRAAPALRSAYAFTILWFIVSSALGAIAPFYIMARMSFATGAATAPAPNTNLDIALSIASAVGATNPVLVLSSVFYAAQMAPISSVTILDVPQWLQCIVSQFVLVALMLVAAMRAVRKPFAEQYWMEAGGSARGKGAKRGAKQRVGQWFYLPILSRLRFANPVLMRELRGKFRLRRPSPGMAVVLLLVSLVVAYCYGWLLTRLIQDHSISSDTELWSMIMVVALIILMIVMPVMGASAFTREREAGTWEGLMLSLLSPWSIVKGKLIPPLFSAFAYSVPLWPFIIIELCWPGKHGVRVPLAVFTFLVMATTATAYATMGLTLSWLCRRTHTAVGWTVALLILLNLIVPIFIGMSNHENIIDAVNPVAALVSLVESRPLKTAAVEAFLLLHWASTAALFLYLVRAIPRGGRERDKAR